MFSRHKKALFIVADQTMQTRNLISEVLRGAGFDNILHARDGQELIDLTLEYNPQIIITTSRLPVVSGLDFCRMIRAGYKHVPRTLAIIAMTNTATKVFLDHARDAGVDEMLVRPFTAQAVLLRVQSVLERPREFIDSASYVGPCRRRRSFDSYDGPLRRFTDPIGDEDGAPMWEKETARAAVRLCVQKISQTVQGLTDGDRRKLREVYSAVKETEQKADEMRDVMLGMAARSLGRYITAVGASGSLDPETVKTHIDAMHTLGLLTSTQHEERQKLVDGLERIVDKKLGRTRAA
jgi:CheY-like chemotaxis protein